MVLQVVPEGTAEDRVIRRRTGPHSAEQAPPGVRHASAEAFEIEAEMRRRVQQSTGSLVQGEPAGRWFLEHSLADEVPQHPVQGVAVRADAEASSSIRVIPAAMWSAIRRVATT